MFETITNTQLGDFKILYFKSFYTIFFLKYQAVHQEVSVHTIFRPIISGI